METKEKSEKRTKRHARVTKKVQGSINTPRLCVFRSNKFIYCQLINDDEQKTLAHASSFEKTLKEKLSSGKDIKAAIEVGKLIAERALSLGISKVVFDRGGYKYHGRVKALADAAREGGLKF